MDMLRVLYHTIPGRLLLKPLTAPAFSRLAGFFLDRGISKALIPGFISRNHIRMEQYEKTTYHSFNDFFCRKIRPELRPIDMIPEHLVSPCDAFLSIYPVKDGLVLPVKQSKYTISSLLRNDQLARRYDGGYCMVFRLCVDHYHRYCYPDSGLRSKEVRINGVFHTVRPVALSSMPVFKENTREYCLLRTRHFGTLVQMEVGAMLVGRINNDMRSGPVKRGQEKGYFEYGGSTIILLAEKDKIQLPRMLQGAIEVPVAMGEMIASSVK